jgi:hypothetical protein
MGGAGAVVHLRPMSRLCDDDRARVWRSGPAQFADEALDALVGTGDTMFTIFWKIDMALRPRASPFRIGSR